MSDSDSADLADLADVDCRSGESYILLQYLVRSSNMPQQGRVYHGRSRYLSNFSLNSERRL